MNKKQTVSNNMTVVYLLMTLRGIPKSVQLMTFTLEIFLSPCKSVIRITHLQKDLNLQLKQPLFHHISI